MLEMGGVVLGSRGGGTGRRGRLKICYRQRCESSILSFGTNYISDG
jgi:hypothetical protein